MNCVLLGRSKRHLTSLRLLECEMVAFPLHKFPVSYCCTGDYGFVKVTRGSCRGETNQRSKDGCKSESLPPTTTRVITDRRHMGGS